MGHLLKPPSFCSAGELLFMNDELSDMMLIVESNEGYWEIPAHSLILSSQSSVLKEDIEKIADKDDAIEITIRDMSPITLQYLLGYFYTGKMEAENWNEGVDLLEAAFKYKVNHLVQLCGRYLEDVLSLSNVCYIYRSASICNLAALQNRCLNVILDAGFIVLKSKAFETLTKECVLDIVASSDLNVDSELVVFKSLLRWAQVECCRSNQEVTQANILSELKPFLQHVCIDDMSDTDKSELPPYVLSSVRPNNRNRIVFSVLDTLLHYSSMLRFDVNQNDMDFIGENLCCIRFSVDTPVYLLGFRFTIISTTIPLHLPISMVRENMPKSVMFSHDMTNASWNESIRINQRKWNDTKVLLRHPVYLEADDIYNIYIVDVSSDVQVCKVTLPVNELNTSSGYTTFTIHGEQLWGIDSLIFI